MISFLQNNFATIIIVILLAACIYFAIRKIIKNKKSGIGPCGHKCSECTANCDRKNDE